MLVELLTSMQLFLSERVLAHIIALSCSAAAWAATTLIFIPLHHKVANRPIPHLLERLTNLNWLRTVIWSIAAANVLSEFLNQNPA